MPAATFANAPGLDMAFDEGTPNTLFPGQKLSGTATLTTTDGSVSIGSVKATLYGRSKVKIFQNHGKSSAVYRSRAQFFNLEQELFKSDYTYGSGSYSWPFSFNMPFVADESCLLGPRTNRAKPKDGYLSIDNLDIMQHEMPPPMFHYHGMFGRVVWGFVEYVLEVTVTEAAGSHRIRKSQSRSSTRPINFQPGKAREVLRDFCMQSKHDLISLKSSRLVAEGSELASSHSQSLAPVASNEPITKIESSGSSHMRKMFSRISISPSSTPRLALDCTVSYPTVLQVYHPESFPFKLIINPNLDSQSTNIDPSALPQIKLKSIDLRVLCATRARTLDGLWSERDLKTGSIHVAKEAPLNHIMKLVPATKPPAKSEKGDLPGFQEAANQGNTVNFADLLPLRLTSAKIGRYTESILLPTFKTYNLAREYGMKWTIDLEIITPQKTFREKIKGEVKRPGITVRGAPDSVVREHMMTHTTLDGTIDSDTLETEHPPDDDDEEDKDVSGDEDTPEEEEKRGMRGLWRRSHDGGRAKKEKEEYAREDRRRAHDGASPGRKEQLPKYEA